MGICKKLATGALAMLSLAFTSAASASVIDLRDLPGNFDQGSFGLPNTTLYAQSVIADANLFSEFRVRVTGGTNGTSFNIVISGDRADGGGGLGFAPDFNDIRFTSGLFNAAPGGFTEFTINPNVIVANGERLFITMNAATVGGQEPAGSIRATDFLGSEKYAPGEFVYLNAGTQPNLQVAAINSVPWSHRGPNHQDLAIRAVFVQAVSEPGTLALLGLGLVGAGAIRRRRGARQA